MTKKSATWFTALSPDGTRAVSGAGDKLVHRWDAQRCQEIGALVGHTGKILSLKFFPDGKRVVSAFQDKSLRIWNVESQKLQFVLAAVLDLFSAPDRLVSAQNRFDTPPDDGAESVAFVSRRKNSVPSAPAPP